MLLARILRITILSWECAQCLSAVGQQHLAADTIYRPKLSKVGRDCVCGIQPVAGKDVESMSMLRR